jgi:methylmalonyl-CoA mutase, C-terminal domain
MSSAAKASRKSLRVVVAKPGLDGHDRGAKIIARACIRRPSRSSRRSFRRTPTRRLSILSGPHMTLVPRVVDLLREQQAGDVVVTVGG